MSEPKYLIAERVITRICHDVGIGGKLPTEKELCQILGYSRITVRRAVDALAAQGIIRRIQGSGMYVEALLSPPPEVINPLGFHAQMTRRGHRVHSVVAFLATVPASPEAASALGRPLDTPLIKLVRLRLLDGSPHHLTTSWWDPQQIPAEERSTYEDHSLYALFREHGVELSREDVSVYLGHPSADAAALLDISAREPRLMSDSTVFRPDARPVALSRTIRRDLDATVSFSMTAEGYPQPGAMPTAPATPTASTTLSTPAVHTLNTEQEHLHG